MSAHISLPSQIPKQAHFPPASATPDVEAAGGDECAFTAVFRQISEQNASKGTNDGQLTPSDAKPLPEDLVTVPPFQENIGLPALSTPTIHANMDIHFPHDLPKAMVRELAAISAALRQAADVGTPASLPPGAHPVLVGELAGLSADLRQAADVGTPASLPLSAHPVLLGEQARLSADLRQAADVGTPASLPPGAQPVLVGEQARLSADLRQAADVGTPAILPLGAHPVGSSLEGEASPVPPASTFLRPLTPAWEKAGAETNYATTAVAATATAQGRDFVAVQENMPNLSTGSSQAALAHPGLQAGVGLQAGGSYGLTLPLAHSVGTPAWGQELGQRIVWMANSQESQAELVLTPPQLGRVAISLSISGDHATASFVCANPAVREAIEAALPRLRETLAEAGIQLGQAHVGAEHPGQSGHPRQFGRHADSGHDAFARLVDGVELSGMGDDPALPPPLKSGRGIIDLFA